jgi:hypothetical protein
LCVVKIKSQQYHSPAASTIVTVVPAHGLVTWFRGTALEPQPLDSGTAWSVDYRQVMVGFAMLFSSLVELPTTSMDPFYVHVNSFEVISAPWEDAYHRIHDTIWVALFSKLK